MNTTQILVGVEINKNNVPTEIYILEKQSISRHDARTVDDFVREKLIINHNWD
ncbi:hypothetical protein SKUN_00779 [Spiroplasma kunkelii CR2-3x]|uniref:Uncharacterized protein n=1 Tax=Spiroplasma kunkelii CR2-3x TaxID=273035 RepID=A0A0K2JGF1_SPIKU|nr:hypothetical protein [Spiroplasma kunkelii]ALA97669.1 hypothetical protein SKUN_00779 [Spiroplasma kunkelii CR2-3x]